MIGHSVPIRNRERSNFKFEVGSCFSNPLISYFDGAETEGQEHPFIVISVDEKTVCCVMARTYTGYIDKDEKLLPQCKCPLDTEHQRYFTVGQIYVFSKDEVINDLNFTIYKEADDKKSSYYDNDKDGRRIHFAQSSAFDNNVIDAINNANKKYLHSNSMLYRYNEEVLNQEQIDQVFAGYDKGLTDEQITLYAKEDFTAEQMQEIRIAIEEHSYGFLTEEQMNDLFDLAEGGSPAGSIKNMRFRMENITFKNLQTIPEERLTQEQKIIVFGHKFLDGEEMFSIIKNEQPDGLDKIIAGMKKIQDVLPANPAFIKDSPYKPTDFDYKHLALYYKALASDLSISLIKIIIQPDINPAAIEELHKLCVSNPSINPKLIKELAESSKNIEPDGTKELCRFCLKYPQADMEDVKLLTKICEDKEYGIDLVKILNYIPKREPTDPKIKWNSANHSLGIQNFSPEQTQQIAIGMKNLPLDSVFLYADPKLSANHMEDLRIILQHDVSSDIVSKLKSPEFAGHAEQISLAVQHGVSGDSLDFLVNETFNGCSVKDLGEYREMAEVDSQHH